MLNTKIEIPPSYWDEKNGKICNELPLAYGNTYELNEKLKTMYRVTEDLILIAVRENIPSPGEI